jgi:hypothetical protein
MPPFVCIHIYLNMLNTVTSLHPASQEIEIVEYSVEIKDPTTVNTCLLQLPKHDLGCEDDFWHDAKRPFDLRTEALAKVLSVKVGCDQSKSNRPVEEKNYDEVISVPVFPEKCIKVRASQREKGERSCKDIPVNPDKSAGKSKRPELTV